jgi:ParB family chromosome partitioning protein
MTSSRKQRMSLLDNLAAAGAPSPAAAPSMMSSNRALRSARDAVDAHHVWELDPASIEDTRLKDRLDPSDVIDLREAIETNGQTVPILVRRDPKDADRYLLIYGRRRLEAIRQSDKVAKVRALVASMDEDAALRAQISENMARRDLSFIEKALLAQSLVTSGFGNQSQVAEVLTVTKSAVSMAISVVEAVGEDLVRAIGPAHGVGRPKWDALARGMVESQAAPARLIEIAEGARSDAALARLVGEDDGDEDPSRAAFDAVLKAVSVPKSAPKPAKPGAKPPAPRKRSLSVNGQAAGSVQRTAKGVQLVLEDGAFAQWVEAEAQDLIDELHARWLQQAED